MNVNLSIYKLLSFFIVLATFGCSENNKRSQVNKLKSNPVPEKFYTFEQFRSDTLFDSSQIISLLSIDDENLDEVSFDFLFEPVELIQTSDFAKNSGAFAAVNAGFFDMDKGGSITYFEVGNSVLGVTKDDELFNGAIVLDDEEQLRIEETKKDSVYEHSKAENGVLVSGPILLLNGNKSALPDRSLVTDRHPRTCICETASSILLVAIDGRTLEAAGMTLMEVQDFLLSKKCLNAINLDGGGSTTMWLKDKGVVNYPSDITGERGVANVLIIKLDQ